ncbi:MAG: 1-deoxy-D-xylulose-5-phosphate synthase [Firmicutes bacterium]|nr:1-deoxy-D-xylulose-5-phosphate synthase [Candidatus Fiminaster equi]
MSKKDINKVKHIDLDSIENPKFLAALSYEELDVLASDIRGKILEVTSNLGGHLSSNLGVVELTIALHRVFDLSKDKLIFDVGHQCYTHKILTGRKLNNLRQQDGVSGFQKIDESPYDVYEAGHSSTSISAANGFAIARDLNKEKYNVIALIGDGAINSGLALEGLNNIAHSDHKVIIVLNDNGMSISKPVGGLSKFFANISTSKGYNRMKHGYQRLFSKTKFGRWILHISSKFKNCVKRTLTQGNLFTSLGFAYIGPVDGNNIKKVEKALLRAKNTKKSVIIHVNTFKGKGYKYAEDDEAGYWHGVSPFDVETGEPKNKHEGMVSWSHVYSDITALELEEHKNAILISPATIKGAGLDCLDKKFDNRIIDVGIAEEHAATLASGLSISGKHPIISVYSTFLQRAYDEVSHDLARMNLNATFLVDRAGLVGADGETHQGIYDEGYLSSIPGTVITMASNIDEAKLLYDESFNNHGPFFIRLPRTLVCKQDGFNKIEHEFGKWMKVKEDSKDVAIISCGPLMRELENALNNEGIKCTLINALYINPIDKSMLDELLEAKKIVIYDPYSTRKGLVDSVMAYLLEKNFKGSISAYFVPNEFVKQGTIAQQLERYNIRVIDVISELKK